MKYLSPAKINLALDVLRKDESGYHEVQMVLHEIPLYDEIIIEKTDGKTIIEFIGEEAHLIDASDNTAMKALNLLQLKSPYKISIHKKIPIGSGLGGGSSNAATILKAFNEIENLGLSNEELRSLANKISKDAVFFIEGKTALVTHFGEAIQKLPQIIWKNHHLLLIVQQQRKSTSNMYSEIDIEKSGKNLDKSERLIEAIQNRDTNNIWKNIHNDFENITFDEFVLIKEKLNAYSIENVALTGAGTALYAVSSNPFDLEALSQALPHQRILDLRPSEGRARSW